MEDVAEEVGNPAPPTYWGNYEHGINPREWRQGWGELPAGMDDISTRKLFGKDFPEFVEHYLDLRDTEGENERVTALKKCLDAYSVADVEILFGIAEDERLTDYGASRVSLIL